jgi:hydroxymethylpyrimidine/phosphomethylpyrimidine kinase
MNEPHTKVFVNPHCLKPKAVLCISGLDPTGGAGLQADIEALVAVAVHALPVMTANTVQTTSNVESLFPTDPAIIARQLEVLAKDCAIDAVKIGLLGSIECLQVVSRWLRHHRLPVVCDPVLRAGGGASLADDALIDAMLEALCPSVTLLTPNAAEARRLIPQASSLNACGQALLEAGCANVLITGGDEPGHTVVDTWFARDLDPVTFIWPRIQGSFHGAGCTLASAVAGRLALGQDMKTALVEAQAWTHEALAHASPIGRGRSIPRRFA